MRILPLFAVAIAWFLPIRSANAAPLPGCAIQDDVVAAPRVPGSMVLFDAGCRTYGPCDDPAVRDTTMMEWLNLRTVVHVMRRSDGSGGVTRAVADATLAQINEDMRATGTGFQLDVQGVRFHDDTANYCLQPCEALHQCQDSFSSLRAMKALYAEDPEHTLNIYIGCHPTTSNGSLAGISTYPWTSTSIRATGGFWVNVNDGVGAGNFVATHELGHALGLYHTFRGVSEIDSCGDPCVENVGAFDNDWRGDFAADTPPTPVQPDCGPPPGLDCLGTSWGPTQPENFMGYGPPGCQNLFTLAQKRRMQCWTRQVLRGWLTSPPATCERLADPGTTGLWHLDEGTGASAANAVDGGENADVFGAAWSVSGCGSPSVTLSGGGAGVRLPASVSPASPAGTLECTFQWDGTTPGPDGAWLFDQSTGPGSSNLGLVLAPDSTLHLHIAGAERVASTTRIRPGRWYRVAAMWDGATARIALDDLLDAEAIAVAVPLAPAAPMWFGRSGGTVPDGDFHGGLDEIRLSLVARTTAVPPAPVVADLSLALAPNPASGSLAVRFTLPNAGRARAELFDLAGRRIAALLDGDLTAGAHVVRWAGTSSTGDRVRAGVYVVRLIAGGTSSRRTLVWTP